MRAYLTLTRAGLRAFVRDRTGLFWSFFFPLFFIFIFGAIFGRAQDDESNVKFDVGLVLPPRSPAAQGVQEAFRHVPVLVTHAGAREGETEALRAGKRRAVVVFPADLDAKLQAGTTAEATILFDPAQAQAGQMVAGIVRSVLDEMDRRMSGRQQRLRAVTEPLPPKEAKSGALGRKGGMEFLLPGILAMTVMQLGLFTAIPFITMREKGVLKRLRATPLPRGTVVGSQVTQRLIIGVIQTLTIIGIGTAFYHFRVAGSWPVLLGIVSFGVLTFICIGAVLASIAKTQESGISLVQLVNFPMMFLTGLFIPVEILPAYLKPVMHVLPATYLADALRHIMSAAPSAYSLPLDVAVMGGWLLGGLLLAFRLFRWE